MHMTPTTHANHRDGRGAAMSIRTRCARGAWSLLALTLIAAPACTTDSAEPPDLAGPSEMGMSVQLQANPDVLTKDGSSQSTIVITVRNANGQAASGVGLRVETAIGGVVQDYGRLSTKSVTTGSDGRASVVYTAPSGPPAGNSAENETMLQVLATPAGTDFNAAVGRAVTIRLVPSGVILPPETKPGAKFTFSPTAPTQGQEVAFDASQSTGGVSFAWDFGDGTTGTGAQTRHRYHNVGSYVVTLTVTNDRGTTDKATAFVNVTAGQSPTASFSFSPSSPEVLQQVFFNASASTAAPGRSIVSYDWTFGDGGTASGVTVTHRFATPGSWNVVLTVTDDVGKTGTTAQSITLGPDLVPTADFTYSPTAPTVGSTINFDARLSQPPAGRTLARYEWNFGNGVTAEGERVSHRYTAAGTYSVVLTVYDNTGAKKSVVKTVSVL